MYLERLMRLSEEEVRNLHRNCLLKLDDPDRGKDAAAILADVHSEFARRAAEEEQGGFLPMLRCVGYNVQWQKLGVGERRRLLDWILGSDLPAINDSEFMASWGEAGTARRLECLVETIETYRRRYGSGPNMENAASRWEADLAYLRAQAAVESPDEIAPVAIG